MGVGGGVLSGVNMGFCRPIPTTHSKTVRVNGSFVDYHVGTYMFMNCAGPEGPFNTIGQVIFLGNMLPGPVDPSGKIPKGCICGDSGMLSEIQSKLGDADELIAKGKKLYELAKTDWSDPSAVLGAIGGVAGIAGLQDIADLAKQGKEIYDTGKKILDTDWSDPSSILGALGGAAGIGGFEETAAMIAKGKDLYDKGKKIIGTDWSDPKQALAAVASGATIAGMDGIASAANLASKVRDVIKTDWSDPKAALAAATNIMKSTGLNKMVAELASDAITSNDPNGASNQLPSCFPKPGSKSQSPSSKSGSSGSSQTSGGLSPNDPNWLPPSKDGKPRQRITQDVLDDMRINNPTAAERYDLLNEKEKKEAFVETNKPSKTKDGQPVPENKRIAVYLPGQGFSTTPEERENSFLPPTPEGIKEIFVAEKDGDKENFLGIKQKKGNWYLFGGLMDLGSPEMPGAGNANMWFIPDNFLGIDMSKYYDYHDEDYYGSDVGIGDIGSVLEHELIAFGKGLSLNPLQWPLQAIYSTATTGIGLATILQNTTKQVDGALSDVLGKIDSGSFKDIFSSVFGASEVNPNDLVINNIVPGGCMGPEVPTLPGQSAPGTGSGAPGSGAPPKPGTAGAPEGDASGAGKDGILVTTKQGNPAAAAAAIEAQFRKENKAALDKAQAEEKAAQEKAAQEKAEQEKAEQEKAEQEKAAQEKAAQEKANQEKADTANAVKDKAAESKKPQPDVEPALEVPEKKSDTSVDASDEKVKTAYLDTQTKFEDGHGEAKLEVGLAKTKEGVVEGEYGGAAGQVSVFTGEASAQGGYGYGAGGKAQAEVSMGEVAGSVYAGSDSNNPVLEVGLSGKGPSASAKGDILIGDDGRRVGIALGGKVEANVAEGKVKGESCFNIPFTDKNVCVNGSVSGSVGVGGAISTGTYYDRETGRVHSNAELAAGPAGAQLDVSIGNRYENRERPNK